jgi:cell division protein FtsB
VNVSRVLDPVLIGLVSLAIAVATFLYATYAQKITRAADQAGVKAAQVAIDAEAEAGALRTAQADIARLAEHNADLEREVAELRGGDQGGAPPRRPPRRRRGSA